jgi:hypothetical protein
MRKEPAMDKPTTTEYLVDTKLGPHGEHVRLRNIRELAEWVKREREYWSWLLDATNLGHLGYIKDHFHNAFSEIENHIVRAQNVNLNEIREWSDNFMRKYQNLELLHSGTREAHFVITPRESFGDVEALTALGMLLNRPRKVAQQLSDLNDLRSWRGIISLVMMQQGISGDAVTANRHKLDKLFLEYNERLSTDAAATDDLKDRLAGLVSDHEAIRAKGRDDMAKALKLAREQAEQQRAEAHEAMEQLQGVYSASLGLEAPVEYWKKKSERHRRWMKRLFVGFGFYVAAVAGAVGWFLYATVLDEPTFWKSAGLELVGLTLAAFGMLLAVARIIYKLAASQLHLYNDADERGTMVEAYLALRKGGHADENHMAIVLERLFAPGSDGIVKDEFLVTWADHVRSGLAKQ